MLVLTVGLLLAADKAKDQGAKKAKDDVAGTWSVVSVTIGGQDMDDAKGDTVTFADGTVKMKGKNGDHEGTYKVRADKKPKQMDFTPSDGDQAGKVRKGIYELKGDTLKVLIAEPDEKRPKDFKNKDGAGLMYVVLKREKA
jgi:uncharacterized protein (TIGR03067 family)